MRLKNSLKHSSQMDKPPLAIYVHWPYCARICPYCDFNVYKQRADSGLVEAICADLIAWRNWSGPRDITSVHFGGGTPSLMSGNDIGKILKQVDDLWGLPDRAEIGLEANPNNAAIEKLDAFKAGGINRLSLGVQSFHDPALKQLGRDHNGATARAAIIAALSRFRSISADLIFGWHGQTDDLLDQDLTHLLSLKLDHISTYQLTIEEGTAFAKAEARDDIQAVDNDRSADFYENISERLSRSGYKQYEVSNFSKLGHRSKHNMIYWLGGDYVGVGPGAHGRMTVDNIRYATIAALRPKDYADHVLQQGRGFASREALSAQEWREEYLLMGLRIKDGLSEEKLNAIYADKELMRRVEDFINDGYLQRSGSHISVTNKGRPLLNHLTEKLLVG